MVEFPSVGMLREVPPGYVAQYVIDASVAMKWVLLEDLADEARRYARSAIQGRVRLSVPSLFWYEIANALRYATDERKEAIPSRSPWEFFRSVPLHTIEFSIDAFPFITALAERHGITVYDAAYVFLAQSLQIPLITADRGLVRRCANVPFVWSLDSLNH